MNLEGRLSKLDEGEYPCIKCYGRGWNYDEDDPPDIIEGNKLRDRIKCHECYGTKKGKKSDWLKLFKADKQIVKLIRKNQLATLKQRKVALAKLTREEQRVLGLI